MEARPAPSVGRLLTTPKFHGRHKLEVERSDSQFTTWYCPSFCSDQQSLKSNITNDIIIIFRIIVVTRLFVLCKIKLASNTPLLRLKHDVCRDKCDSCATDHVVRNLTLSPSAFAYCKQSKTGIRESLGMRLVCRSRCCVN